LSRSFRSPSEQWGSSPELGLLQPIWPLPEAWEATKPRTGFYPCWLSTRHPIMYSHASARSASGAASSILYFGSRLGGRAFSKHFPCPPSQCERKPLGNPQWLTQNHLLPVQERAYGGKDERKTNPSVGSPTLSPGARARGWQKYCPFRPRLVETQDEKPSGVLLERMGHAGRQTLHRYRQ
jgi:hypothetical protein